MVTKQQFVELIFKKRLILAKNHMVTKLVIDNLKYETGLILAKNHMVTKLCFITNLI